MLPVVLVENRENRWFFHEQSGGIVHEADAARRTVNVQLRT